MMKLFSAMTYLVLSDMSKAFAPSPIKPTRSQSQSSTDLNIMTQEETSALLDRAGACVEECSLDNVSELINLLQTQQGQLSERLDEMRRIIESLERVNTHDDRKVDEIRETVRALYRVFQLGSKASNNDYPSLSKPSGYSGDVGDGPTDAYKALKPKPWTSTL
ncbi:hypothetical protein MPSEU_000895600 [Mayamaea pseudoterrestris]|nr:hypothetical protein MPSEU_000895600 [Mayamaea pseudoterrestris]